MTQNAESDVKILIVEDNEDLRNLLTIQLKKLGYQNLELKSDGQEAYNACVANLQAKTPFDAVISDIRMPKMSGLELLKKIRGNVYLSDLPFMIITGHGEVEHVKEAISSKVSQFITRPYEEKILAEKVAALFPKRKKKS
jgi:two-component system chemotaxis response regulator CheY